MTDSQDSIRARLEGLWESLGGDLCICQRADVSHWCEKCQQRLQLLGEFFSRELATEREAREAAHDELDRIVLRTKAVPSEDGSHTQDIPRGLEERVQEIVSEIISLRFICGRMTREIEELQHHLATAEAVIEELKNGPESVTSEQGELESHLLNIQARRGLEK